jgi:hypothetical protein
VDADPQRTPIAKVPALRDRNDHASLWVFPRGFIAEKARWKHTTDDSTQVQKKISPA